MGARRMSKISIKLAFLLTFIFASTLAEAQSLSDICDRRGNEFLGRPFVVRYVIPLESEDDQLTGLFKNSRISAPSKAIECKSDSIVGAIDCVGEDIENAKLGATQRGNGPLRDANGDADTPSDAKREATMLLTVRPVFVPGEPITVRMEPVPEGQAVLEFPEDMTPSEQGKVEVLFGQQIRLLKKPQAVGRREMNAVLDGRNPPIRVPLAGSGIQMSRPAPKLFLASCCGSLFDLLSGRAQKNLQLAVVEKTIASTKAYIKRRKAEDNAWIDDAPDIDDAEATLVALEAEKNRIEALIDEDAERIKQREGNLAQENRESELHAIKSNLTRLAAEEDARRNELIAARRERTAYRFRLLAGERAYAQELAALDAMALTADRQGRSDFADVVRENRGRLAEARDDWSRNVQGTMQVHEAVEARLMARNKRDGIGPTTDIQQLIEAEGKDAGAIFHYDQAMKSGAEFGRRQALRDALTLGGSSTTGGPSAKQFAMDVGETMMDEIRDPTLRAKRMAAYAEGLLEGGANVGSEAIDAATEAFLFTGEILESAQESLTNRELDVFGDERLRAAAEAYESMSRMSPGELHGVMSDAAYKALRNKIADTDKAFSRYAGMGEDGIREGIKAVGVTTAEVFAAEELAVRSAVKALETAADVARLAPKTAEAVKKSLGKSDLGGTAPEPASRADVQSQVCKSRSGHNIRTNDETLRYDDVDFGDATQSVARSRRPSDLDSLTGPAAKQLDSIPRVDGEVTDSLLIIGDDEIVFLSKDKKLGEGGSSRVYRHSDGPPPTVIKIAELEDGPIDALEDVVGHSLATDVAKDAEFFDVTGIESRQIIETSDGRQYLVTVAESADPTNRYSSFKDRMAKQGRSEITEAEALTLSAAVREMNARGYVYTDLKAGNFDIVADLTTRTGHRVVFLDKGGFRKVQDVQGWADASQAARTLQNRFAATRPDLTRNEKEMIYHILRDATEKVADDTAFGGQIPAFLTSPGGPRKLGSNYSDLTSLDDGAFSAEATRVLQGTGRLRPGEKF